jgi:hypothetical protein
MVEPIGSILAQKQSLRSFGNQGIHIFWAGIMATKKHFFPYGSLSIRDGSEIRF